MLSSTWNGEGCTCLEPENIMCSKRWAKPLLPGVWLAAPTWYQTSTATCGSRWSSLRITVSPFFSWYFSNLMSGSAARAAKASPRQPIAAILRMDGLRRACLTRAARGGKARIRVLRIVGDFLREPRWPLEALPLVRQLDLGQPEIALAKVVELEAPELAPHLAQAARAHPQQGFRVLVGNRVVELRPGQETVPLDGQLGVADPVVRGDQPHPHRRIHAQVALLQLVALRQLPGEEVLAHQKLPLDLYAHRDLLISRSESQSSVQPPAGVFDFLRDHHVLHRVLVPLDV